MTAAQDGSRDVWLFLGAGIVLLIAAGVGTCNLIFSDSDDPMSTGISPVGPPDGRGRRRPDGSGSRKRRAGGRGARCGDSRMGGVSERQTRTSCGGGRRVRFAATAADGPESEDVVLLRNCAIDEETAPVQLQSPTDMTAASEEERRLAVLESLQALDRAQYEGHRKRVELTAQVEHKRFWGPEATPQLIDEPVPFAL